MLHTKSPKTGLVLVFTDYVKTKLVLHLDVVTHTCIYGLPYNGNVQNWPQCLTASQKVRAGFPQTMDLLSSTLIYS